MGVYQDEIDNHIQPRIDALEAIKAELLVDLSFLEGLASDITNAQFKTAAAAHSNAGIQEWGTELPADETDANVQAWVASRITHKKTLLGTHSTYVGYKDHVTKGDDSTLAWRESSVQADLDAWNSKKTAWLAKESDPTDTTSYTAVVQPE
jgi:hypothetical protein